MQESCICFIYTWYLQNNTPKIHVFSYPIADPLFIIKTKPHLHTSTVLRLRLGPLDCCFGGTSCGTTVSYHGFQSTVRLSVASGQYAHTVKQAWSTSQLSLLYLFVCSSGRALHGMYIMCAKQHFNLNADTKRAGGNYCGPCVVRLKSKSWLATMLLGYFSVTNLCNDQLYMKQFTHNHVPKPHDSLFCGIIAASGHSNHAQAEE